MAERDPRGPDPDDWFADGGGAPSRRARPAAADDWTASMPRFRRQSQLAELLPGQWGPIAAGAVVLVVIVIAWIALSGGGSSPAKAVTTSQVNTTPTTTPITTQVTPAVSAPKTTLKPGDTGAQVKALQRALASLGYSVGKVDGDYGTGTKTALSQFQTAAKLTADGVFGPATRAALIKALRTG